MWLEYLRLPLKLWWTRFWINWFEDGLDGFANLTRHLARWLDLAGTRWWLGLWRFYRFRLQWVGGFLGSFAVYRMIFLSHFGDTESIFETYYFDAAVTLEFSLLGQSFSWRIRWPIFLWWSLNFLGLLSFLCGFSVWFFGCFSHGSKLIKNIVYSIKTQN